MDSSTWSDAQALAYIASYADLRQAFGANPEAGRRHYAQVGAAEGRTVTFDAMAYLASYADLRAAFGSNTVAAIQHFVGAGAAEGRTVTFDAMAYLASYADLRAAFGSNTVAATQHFVDAGAAEGRTVTFDAMAYLASYADLRAAFGSNTVAATQHFVDVGAAEGRTVTFDAMAYLASYADLRAAFGSNTVAATQHFVGAGAAEGRTVTFDAPGYIASYADLAAFGSDTAAAARHYVQVGAAQGRVANGLVSAPALAAASDSGITGDNITSDLTPLIEGLAAAGSLVKVYVDGRQTGTATANSSGKWSYNVGSYLPDGTHSISAVVGNSQNKAVSITIDTQDPLKPGLPKLSLASDTGIVGDGRTMLTTPTIDGIVEANGTAIVYVDGRKVASVLADAAGAWSYKVESALTTGDHAVYVRSADAAGNVSDKSDALNVRIQSPVGSATLTTGIDDVLLSDLGGTVTATAATLTQTTTTASVTPPYITATTLGDRLVGGTGYDTLQLFGGGDFRVDRLGGFTGFEKVLVTNPGGTEARVYLGSQDIELGVSQGSYGRFYLGSGKVDFQGTASSSVTVTSATNWNVANVIKGQAPTPSNPLNSAISITFGEYTSGTTQTYDLRSASLSRVSINSYATNNTFLVNTATMGAVSSWNTSSSYNTTLSVSDASINLASTSLSGFKVVSTNTAGTTFTTTNSFTALQVQGGTGQDTLVLNGSSFTADQRNTIFATASVETITDTSGTYRIDPNLVRLTTGVDQISTPATGGTVTATAATLTQTTTTASVTPPYSQTILGDQLTGGTGYDTLQLFGGGDFRVDRLGGFTGFEKVLVTNPGSTEARVYLGNQNIELGVSQGSYGRFYLGSGKVDFQGTASSSVTVTSATNWNVDNVIKGQAPTPGNPLSSTISITFGEYTSGTTQTYDLRSAGLSWVSINSYATNNTFLVNTATMGAVSSWNTSSSYNTTLSVSDASINLASTSLSGFKVVSTNTAGTTFTTTNSFTALQVQGGTGQDTLVLNGSSFTADQRNTIFATASVETITDTSGTYRIDPNLVRLTTGVDQISTPATGGTVTATAATLTQTTTTASVTPPYSQTILGDQLTGGTGYDTLQLFGGGDFRVDRLGGFTGFEKVLVTNPGSTEARVYLGNQNIELGVSQGSYGRFYLGSGKVDFQGTASSSVTVTSATNWNVDNVIKGQAPTPGNPLSSTISITFGEYTSGTTQTYDLRSAGLSWVSINSYATNNTFLVNTATMGAVSSWNTSSSYNTTLSVSDASINLASTSLSGFKVVSTNTAGTTFTTTNSFTALQVQGGTGQDTLVLNGSSFTADQRNTIFATASVETIIDTSGTYRKPVSSSASVEFYEWHDLFANEAAGVDEQSPADAHQANDEMTWLHPSYDTHLLVSDYVSLHL